MAAPPKKKTEQKSGSKKKSYAVYKLYEVKGDQLVRKNKFSPKAAGCFMANHKDRLTCGQTGYTEIKDKKST